MYQNHRQNQEKKTVVLLISWTILFPPHTLLFRGISLGVMGSGCLRKGLGSSKPTKNMLCVSGHPIETLLGHLGGMGMRTKTCMLWALGILLPHEVVSLPCCKPLGLSWLQQSHSSFLWVRKPSLSSPEGSGDTGC